MSTAFDQAFAAIIGVEGGYSAPRPGDPGGETKFGISKRAYPQIDISSLTIDEAKAIYFRDYWAPVRGDELPWPLALFVFDAEVNQGQGTAVRLLQKSLGVSQDGSFGAQTRKALTAARQTELCAMFMADRALRYMGTRNFDTNGRGWLKRLFAVVQTAT